VNQAIATREEGDITNLVERMASDYSRDQIDLIKKTLLVLPKGMDPREVTDMELALCFAQAKERNLRPLAKQCYFIKWTKDSQLECYPSWDGLIKQAIDTDEYEGMEGPFFSADGVHWTEAWLEDEPPAAAKCLVYRKGHRVPTTGVATWKASCRFYTRWDKNLGRSVPTKDPLPMWQTDGPGQLGKCAKRIAVRTAFPLEVDDPISPEQLKALHTLASMKGLGGKENRDVRLLEASKIVGRDVESFKELRRLEASEVFEAWSDDVDTDELVEAEIVEDVTAGEPVPQVSPEDSTGEGVMPPSNAGDGSAAWSPVDPEPATDVPGGVGATKGQGTQQAPTPPAPTPEPSTLDVLMREYEDLLASGKRPKIIVTSWLASFLSEEKLPSMEHADEEQAKRGLTWFQMQFRGWRA
jgi:RecT family protein